MNSSNPKVKGLTDKALSQLNEAQKLTRCQVLQKPIFTYWHKYKSGELIIPEYQRGFIWNLDLRSALIESILLSIPVGVVYLFEPQDYRLPIEIVDGSQRIRSIISFLDNEFALQGLELLTELNGLYMRDIGDHHLITSETLACAYVSERAKETGMDNVMFKRVNSYQAVMSDEDYVIGAYLKHPIIAALLQENGMDRTKTLNNLKLLVGSINRDDLCTWLDKNLKA